MALTPEKFIRFWKRKKSQSSRITGLTGQNSKRQLPAGSDGDVYTPESDEQEMSENDHSEQEHLENESTCLLIFGFFRRSTRWTRNIVRKASMRQRPSITTSFQVDDGIVHHVYGKSKFRKGAILHALKKLPT